MPGQPLPDQRHPGRAADQHHLVDRHAAGGQRGHGQAVEGALQIGLDHRLERTPGQRHRRVHRGGQPRQFQRGRLGGVQLALADLGLGPDAVPDPVVLAEVDVVALADLAQRVADHPLVEVVAAQPGVAGRAEHRHPARAGLDDRRVEGAAAEVVDGERAGPLGADGHGRRHRLVEQAAHGELGEPGGLGDRPALRLPPYVVGTVITASCTGSPVRASARRLSSISRYAQTSCGWYSRPRNRMRSARPELPLDAGDHRAGRAAPGRQLADRHLAGLVLPDHRGQRRQHDHLAVVAGQRGHAGRRAEVDADHPVPGRSEVGRGHVSVLGQGRPL